MICSVASSKRTFCNNRSWAANAVVANVFLVTKYDRTWRRKVGITDIPFFIEDHAVEAES